MAEISESDLKDDLLRAEGYSQGFKDGYASCVKGVLEKMKKEKEPNVA